MKIQILVGSGDVDSHSLNLGKAIAKELQAQAEVELVNLVEYGLPLYDRAVERANNYDDKTAAFLAKSHAAEAFVWITPIYHGSFSSTLKNALDWQHFFHDGKVVGLAGHGNNRSSSAVDQLMIVARSQHLLTTPSRVCTANEDYDTGLNITSPDIQSRITNFCNELIGLVKKYNPQPHS